MLDKNIKDENKETPEERWRRETRPPNGQQLLLHSLRFAEVIRLNDYEQFKKGLDLLYQGVVKNKSAISIEQEYYRKFISQARESFFASGGLNLQGFVSKEYADSIKKGIIVSPIRDLPPGVERISFFLSQVLSSSIVFVVHVEYQKLVSDSLNRLFTDEFFERTEKLQDITLHIPRERVKEESIQEFFLKIQSEAEVFISTFFKGVFLSEKQAETQARCPSIKLFSLQNIPFTSKETLIPWIIENQRFIETFGFLPFHNIIYQFNNEYLMFNYQMREHRESPFCITLLSSESIFSDSEAHKIFGSPLHAMEYKYDTNFNKLLTIMTYCSFLWWHSNKSTYYRNNIPTLISNTGDDIKKQFDLMCNAKSAINNDYYDFVRLKKEIERYITSPKSEKRLFNDIPEFELLNDPKNLSHYAKELVFYIDNLSSDISKEYSLLNERYSDLFETINTQASFKLNQSNTKLQKVLIGLTIAIVVFTIVMAYFGYKQYITGQPQSWNSPSDNISSSSLPK